MIVLILCSSVAQDVVQMLGGISSSLLDSLKEVLVERNKLTLGKELGKGQSCVSLAKQD